MRSRFFGSTKLQVPMHSMPSFESYFFFWIIQTRVNIEVTRKHQRKPRKFVTTRVGKQFSVRGTSDICYNYELPFDYPQLLSLKRLIFTLLINLLSRVFGITYRGPVVFFCCLFIERDREIGEELSRWCNGQNQDYLGRLTCNFSLRKCRQNYMDCTLEANETFSTIQMQRER